MSEYQALSFTPILLFGVQSDFKNRGKARASFVLLAVKRTGFTANLNSRVWDTESGQPATENSPYLSNFTSAPGYLTQTT